MAKVAQMINKEKLTKQRTMQGHKLLKQQSKPAQPDQQLRQLQLRRHKAQMENQTKLTKQGVRRKREMLIRQREIKVQLLSLQMREGRLQVVKIA